MKKKADFIIGMLFAVATIIFIIIFLTNDSFFNWAFEKTPQYFKLVYQASVYNTNGCICL